MADACWQVLGTLTTTAPASSCSTAMLPQPCCQRAAVVAVARSYWVGAARLPGRLQQMLAGDTPGKLVWLLQHGLLPAKPSRCWPPPPLCQFHAGQGLCCLRFGQLTAAAALRRFAAQLSVQAPAGMLVQGCLQGAARRAAAGGVQAAAAVQQQTAFAEYLEALAFLAQGAGELNPAVQLQGMPTTDILLIAIACSWNAALLLEGKGLPQRVGLGAPQHLQLCAAAVAPAILQHTPQITCGDVQRLLAVVTAAACGTSHLSALDALRQRPDWLALRARLLHGGWVDEEYLGFFEVQCAAALDVRDVVRLRGHDLDGVSVLRSLEELQRKYRKWMLGKLGAQRLVVHLCGYMEPLPEDSMVRRGCDGLRQRCTTQCSTATA